MNNRLRELRAVRRWSQADLADRLDVSRQTVNAIETGRYDPSLPLAFKLANVFGESIESLFSPDDQPKPEKTTDRNDLKAENTLNGIAYDAEKDRIFVTGKRWKKLYEIKITAPKTQ